jgi:nitroimidazol reductase NimA-like FMN-containing flavoprotein (pyridoxamine 5'-phosphate oxidase superfamily)
MLEKMHDLLKRKDICVLATAIDNKPHCSLMAYVTNEQGDEVYMVTDELSKKYRNMTENPAVCLLVDTRDEDIGPDRLHEKALTVTGAFQKIDAREKINEVERQLLERHEHLRGLVFHPDAVVFAVKIESFLLLEGVSDSYFESLS